LWFVVLVGMIRVRPAQMKKEFTVETMLAGLRYVCEAKLLLGSISLDLFAVLLGGAASLMPIFGARHAGIWGREGWGCCGRCRRSERWR